MCFKDDSDDEPGRMRSVDDLICCDHHIGLTSLDGFFVSDAAAAAVDWDVLTCEAGEREGFDRAGGSKRARANCLRVDGWTTMLLAVTLDLFTTETVCARPTEDVGVGEARVGR